MRLDRIVLQAFGPYPGRTEIDLAPAHAGRSFLICRPTGAGKSSIQDGIYVALFGVVSIDEAGARGRLRCLQADPATPTEITLDFRHGGQTWRIRRRPAGLRPRRGGRMVEIPAESALWRLGPDGTETLDASGVEPVARAVRALLGLDVAAFRAVALLPQGCWRDVLTGPAKDRERLLQEVFGTHWTEALANRLEQDAGAADAEAGAALAAADALAQRIGDATADPAAALAAVRDVQAAAEAALATAEAAHAKALEDYLQAAGADAAAQAGRAIATEAHAEAGKRRDTALTVALDLDPAVIRAKRVALRAGAESLRQIVERRTQTLVQLRQGIAAASASLAQAEAALAGLPPAAPADPILPDRRQAARAALAAAAAEAARRRHGALEADLAAWIDAKASADAAEATRGDARALADLAAGRKGDLGSFARFALWWLLDQTLAGASRHLAALTEGRYALHRQAAGTDGRRAAGLDLDVKDRWDGTRRACATLSGGEGFLAALALALGVSETLQAPHGGRAIGMLILDEGFGSLDPDALDQAADALLGLAAAGRMVGAVSHVPGLEARLGLRLCVRSGRQRSSIAWEGV